MDMAARWRGRFPCSNARQRREYCYALPFRYFSGKRKTHTAPDDERTTRIRARVLLLFFIVAGFFSVRLVTSCFEN